MHKLSGKGDEQINPFYNEVSGIESRTTKIEVTDSTGTVTGGETIECVKIRSFDYSDCRGRYGLTPEQPQEESGGDGTKWNYNQW